MSSFSLPAALFAANVGLLAALSAVVAVPTAFPKSGNGLWYQTPGDIWSREWLPIGNGYLAATLPGGTTFESTQLNIESLWSGGPFEDVSYNGGNKPASQRASLAHQMQEIRQTIFANGTIDNVEGLATDPGAYGSYAGAGFLLETIQVGSKAKVSDYSRWLDMEQALVRTEWSQGELDFERTSFCSHSVRACVQHLAITAGANASAGNITYAFASFSEVALPAPTVSCLDDRTLQVQGSVDNPGMAYELLFRANALGSNASVSCASTSSGNATLTVTGATESWVVWTGDTEYDINAGDQAHNFSFKRAGGVPTGDLVAVLNASAPLSPSPSSGTSLLDQHVHAFTSRLGPFSLSLGQSPDLNRTTDDIIASYQRDTGNTYIEWLLFQYGRYLLASSAPGVLPANLQGKWAWDIANAWSADYHSNINIQMNYWFAETTGMNALVGPLFDYIEKTWAPRGAYTAEVLYNITVGWVTHNEMNIFGHTGMKASGNSAQWADYPESNAWMMIHVWDHFDFTGDVAWWKAQGWPLLKGVASFHLAKLIPDRHFNDSTLVVAPCNSPEQAPITLACAHAQQLIWQLFNAVEKGYAASGDNDEAFLDEIRAKRAQMDKGIHVGSWGQLQEWKVDMDDPNDKHRHLSHLIGLYPGYALSSYDASIQGPPKSGANSSKTYTKEQVLQAAKTSLIHRGDGTAPDGDAGWEKVWRAAAWAQLGDPDKYYDQLTYAIQRNFGANLFSLYDPSSVSPIFQIDANFGYPAAVLNALVQAPDVSSLSTPLKITLLPALPSAWSSGALNNFRIRGGIGFNVSWTDGKLTRADVFVDRELVSPGRQVQIAYAGETLRTFIATKGLHITIT